MSTLNVRLVCPICSQSVRVGEAGRQVAYLDGHDHAGHQCAGSFSRFEMTDESAMGLDIAVHVAIAEVDVAKADVRAAKLRLAAASDRLKLALVGSDA